LKTTVSEENYLKAIYHLQQLNSKVSTNRLAEQLDTRAASVTDMMKKLQAKKLLHYKPYYGFSLSPEGKKVALMVIRRHRLWEYFLAEKLKFGWEEVHNIAEELEHVRHKKLIDRLDEFLGQPAFDPHGDPIPDRHGKMLQRRFQSIADWPVDEPSVLTYVSGQSLALLETLAELQLSLGSALLVKKRSAFDGSLIVKSGKRTLTLTERVAKHLFVSKKL
jgi:DtxR family transcriptional regulator, Mn-dependent transcriptional regulator